MKQRRNIGRKILFLAVALFAMANVAQAQNVAQAILCRDAKTLYFTYQQEVVEQSQFDGHYVTKVWKGDAVLNSGDNTPDWARNYRGDIKKVKFINSFENVRPKSLDSWFWACEDLEEIEGLEYLNTSEVTTMMSMFHLCEGLTSIDLNSFDISSLENARSMFYGCSNLETIYNNKSWNLNVDNAESMFWACKSLKSPSVSYSTGRVEGDMACTFSGYFTSDPEIEGNGTVEKPFQIASADHWNLLADYVKSGRSARHMHFRQTADFTVSTVIGDADHKFEGIYDGDMHVLVANIDNGGSYTALFSHVGNATIKNLYTGGTVKGGRNSAALVGQVNADQGCLIQNCNVKTTVTIGDGDYRAGGIVGHANNSYLTVMGCAFGGTIKTVTAQQGQAAGAIVGEYTTDHMTIKDCFEYGSYGDFASRAMVMIYGTMYDGCINCYTSNQFLDAINAKRVTDDTEGLIVPVVTGQKPIYNTTMMLTDSGIMAQIIKEIEKHGGGLPYDVEMEARIYVEPNNNFTFICPYNVTAKTTTQFTPESITVHGLGTDAEPYYITMSNTGDYGVTVETANRAYAILINDSRTLVFDAGETAYTEGGTYNYGGTDYTINKVWKGNDVLDTGWKTPEWITPAAETIEKVVFAEAFKNVKPKSLFKWFFDCHYLAEIEGIANLNTSEVTVMNATFAFCYNLEEINLNGFDTGKLSNSYTMFESCVRLKTIYCSNTWEVGTSGNMFHNCSLLVGAVKYNNRKTDSSMANPNTGYFTTTGVPHAIWCAGNRTFYFDTPESAVNIGDTYDGQTVTSVWKGDEVIGLPSGGAPWAASAGAGATLAQHVVITDGFASVKPKHLINWFVNFTLITEIEGLDNLNTSEVTSVQGTFAGCQKLQSLDLSTWDLSKATVATQMFHNCEKLETITTNKTWTISDGYSNNMFTGCTELKGAINYDADKITATYANPITGYFTTTEGAVTGDGSEGNPKILTKTAHWEALASYVAAGKTDDNYLYYQLGDNIKTGSTMVGTEDHGFYGQFDGDGKAIEVDIESDEDYAAPFSYVGYSSNSNTTVIRNLVVLGKVQTSAHYAGTIAGQVKYKMNLQACQSFAELNSTVNGAGEHGGLIGNIKDNDLVGNNVNITGCVFSGKLLGSNTTTVGGFVGRKENGELHLVNCIFVPAKVTMSTTNSQTFYRGISGSQGNTNCYYVQTLGDIQGNKAYEIDNEDEYLTLEGKVAQWTYTGSRIYFAGINAENGMMVEVLDEMEDGELEGDIRIFAKQGSSVQISSKVGVNFKDEDGNDIVSTGAGTEADPYTFTMPAKKVVIEPTGTVAYAIWCEGNNTLYFDASDEPISITEPYEGQTITAMWKGGSVVSVGWGTPAWLTTAQRASKVVFAEGFKYVKPNSMNRWFMNYYSLEEVEGTENLNTSEVTTMNSAFFSCERLTRLDIDGFDTGKLTNTSAIFRNCLELKTIFCGKTWILADNKSENMFDNCPNLEGAVAYNPSRPRNAQYANPNNGYFTKKELTLENDEGNTDEIEKFDGIKDVKVILNGRSFARSGYWNTVVLPFNLKIDDTAFDQDGVTARELDVEGTYGEQNKKTGFDAESGTLYLYFKDSTDELKAGVPYIIKWNTGDAITNPEFTGVTIDADAITPTSEDGKVEFRGSYEPVVFTGGDKETIYLGSTNNLIYPQSDVTLKSLRAYFHVDLAGDPQGVRSLKMNFDDETTGILGIEEIRGEWSEVSDEKSDVSGYNLSGQRVSDSYKGVVIKNGKKYFNINR